MSEKNDGKYGKTTSLKINISWTLIGNIIYSLTQWLLLIIITKLGGVSSVGLFTLSLAINAPIITFSKLQLRTLQATDAQNEFNFRHYLSLRLWGVLVAFFAVAVISIFLTNSFQDFLVIIVLTLAKIIEAISDIFYGLFQKYELMKFISLSMILKGIISTLLFFVAFYLTKNLIIASMALAFAWSLLLILFDIQIARKMIHPLPSGIDKQKILPIIKILLSCLRDKKLLKLIQISIPMGIVVMLLSLSTNIPRYFIQYMLGKYHLGIFAGIAYLIIAGDTIITALGQSISPRLAKYYALSQLKEFKNLTFITFTIGFIVGIAGILCSICIGEKILIILYNRDYALYGHLLTWLMLSALGLYLYNLSGVVISSMRQFRVQVPVSLFNLIIGIFSYPFLIKSNGLYGVAWGMGICSFLSMIIYLAIVLNMFKKASKKEEQKYAFQVV